MDAKTIGSMALFLDHHCQLNLLTEQIWIGEDTPEPVMADCAQLDIPSGTLLSFNSSYHCDQGTWQFTCDCQNCVHCGTTPPHGGGLPRKRGKLGTNLAPEESTPDVRMDEQRKRQDRGQLPNPTIWWYVLVMHGTDSRRDPVHWLPGLDLPGM